jgi:hypothetical protein
MEVIPYTLGVVLFTFAVYWSAANMAATPGTPVFGLFRYRESTQGKGKVPAAQPDGRRRFQPEAARPGAARPGGARPGAGGGGTARGDALRRLPRR